VVSKRLVVGNVADRRIKATFAPRAPGCKALFDPRLKRPAGSSPSGATCLEPCALPKPNQLQRNGMSPPSEPLMPSAGRCRPATRPPCRSDGAWATPAARFGFRVSHRISGVVRWGAGDSFLWVRRRGHLSVRRSLMRLRNCHVVMTPAAAANTRMRPRPQGPPMMQTTPTARARRASAKEARATRGEAIGAAPCNRCVFWSPGSKSVISVMPHHEHQRWEPAAMLGELRRGMPGYPGGVASGRGAGLLVWRAPVHHDAESFRTWFGVVNKGLRRGLLQLAALRPPSTALRMPPTWR